MKAYTVHRDQAVWGAKPSTSKCRTTSQKTSTMSTSARGWKTVSPAPTTSRFSTASKAATFRLRYSPMRIDLDNGKYSLVQASNGQLTTLRDGQLWRVMIETVQFSHFHRALFDEIVELRRQLNAADERIDDLRCEVMEARERGENG